MYRPPGGQSLLPGGQRLSSSSLHHPGLIMAGRPPTAAHFGLLPGYPTPTTGQISYPGLYSKQMDHHYRQAETGEPLRQPDLKKRPSLMADFHMSQSNPIIPVVPSTSCIDRGVAGSSSKDVVSKHDFSVRRSLQLDVPAYTPQVENISPTPEDQNEFAGTDKDEILDTIKKVDHEIAVIEEKVRKLHKKKQELAESTSAASKETETDATVSSSGVESGKNQSFFERIYAENRKKAAAAHAKLAHLDPPAGIVPVYQQPWDTKLFEELRKKHEEFKPRLILYLKRQHRAQQIREKYLTERYNQQMQEWKKKMERLERHPKRIAKEQRNREVFEKTFPELKKQREEKERAMRQDGRMLNQGDGSFDSLYSYEEEELMKMRQNAVLPPMMYDERTQKRMRYVNNNNLVRDPIGEHQFRLDLFKMIWTDEEKRLFRAKFVQYGKNFAAIAAFLERKTTKDCVQYYYLTKKRENYKQLMRRPYRRRGKPYKPPQMPRIEDGSKEFGDGNDGDASMSTISEDVTPAAEPEYVCIECRSKIDVHNPGRVLTRSCYEMYGLDPLDPAAQDVRICLKCRLGSVRRRFSQCPIGSCTSVKRRIKPRLFPSKWFELSNEQRRIVAAEFQINDDTTRCCGSCFKRLHRYLEELINANFNAKQDAWKEEDVQRLKEAVSTLGTSNWDAVAANLQGKTADECKQYYSNLEKNVLIGESKKKVGQVPGIEEEEEEDEGGNSEDEDSNTMPTSSVDNSRVASPKITTLQKPSREIKLESSGASGILIIDEENVVDKKEPIVKAEEPVPADDDSCATLSADENDLLTDPIFERRRSSIDKKFMKVDKSQQMSKDILAQRAAAVVPENIPVCQPLSTHQPAPPTSTGQQQPYKPKSRQIHRVEEENRIAAAAAALMATQKPNKPNLLQQVQSLSAVIGAKSSSTSVAASMPGPPSLIAPIGPHSLVADASVKSNTTPMEIRDSESPEVVKVVISRSKPPPIDQQHGQKIPTPKLTSTDRGTILQSGASQQQEPVVRGSLTRGTPGLTPYIVGGDGSGQQKLLDMSKLFRPPSKTEEAGRAQSVDTLKEPRFSSPDPARYTPSSVGREQQQQQLNQAAAAAVLFPQQGLRLPYDQQLALFRQQQLLQAAKQNYDQQQQQQQLLASFVSSLPTTAQARLMQDAFQTALQMQKVTGGIVPPDLTAIQQQQLEQQVAAQSALFQSQCAAAALEQQQQQQHFLAAEQQRRQLEQQYLAEQQKRMLNVLNLSEVDKARLLEHHLRELQQQQGDREAILRTEMAIRQHQQEEALRNERAIRERELVNEYNRRSVEQQQKQLEAAQQQRSMRSPSTPATVRQQIPPTQQQQQKIPTGMVTATQQHMIEAAIMQQHLMKSAQHQQPHLTIQQQQQQQHLQQKQQQISSAVAQQQHIQRLHQQPAAPMLLQPPHNLQRTSPLVKQETKPSAAVKPPEPKHVELPHTFAPPVTRQSIIQHNPAVNVPKVELSHYVETAKRPEPAVPTKAAMKEFPSKAAMKAFPPFMNQSGPVWPSEMGVHPVSAPATCTPQIIPTQSVAMATSISNTVTPPSSGNTVPPFMVPLYPSQPSVISSVAMPPAVTVQSLTCIPPLPTMPTGPPFIPLSSPHLLMNTVGQSSVTTQPYTSSVSHLSNIEPTVIQPTSGSVTTSHRSQQQQQQQSDSRPVEKNSAPAAITVTPVVTCVSSSSSVGPPVLVSFSMASESHLDTPVVTLINSMITKHHAEENVEGKIVKTVVKPAEKAVYKTSTPVPPVPVVSAKQQQPPHPTVVRPQNLTIPVQKLEKVAPSLSEANVRAHNLLMAEQQKSADQNLNSAKMVSNLAPSSANIIKHIDDVIIGEIVQTSSVDSARSTTNIKPPPAPGPPPPATQPELEPVTPDSAPATTMASFPFGGDEKQGGKISLFNMKQNQTSSSSFEYDLEPVSPPEQDYESTDTLPPPASAEPTKSSASTTWPVPSRDISPDLSAMSATPSSVPQMFTNLFTNVFTLPNTSTPSSSAVAPPWSQNISATNSQMVDDNESTRAVAALLETELQNDNSTMMYKIEEPIMRTLSNTTVNLPEYEPLSDDES